MNSSTAPVTSMTSMTSEACSEEEERIHVRTLRGDLFTYPRGYDLPHIRDHIADVWEIESETIHLSAVSAVSETEHPVIEYIAYVEDQRDHTIYYECVTLPSRILSDSGHVSTHSGSMPILVIRSKDRSLNVPVQQFSSLFMAARPLYLASIDPDVQLHNFMGDPYKTLQECVCAYYATNPNDNAWKRFLPRLPMANLVRFYLKPLLSTYTLAQLFRNRRTYLSICRAFKRIGGDLYDCHLNHRLNYRNFMHYCTQPSEDRERIQSILRELSDSLPFDLDRNGIYTCYNHGHHYFHSTHL